jgi:HK97 family phage portal protein
VASLRDTIRGLTSAPTSRRGEVRRGSAALFGSGHSPGAGPFSARAAKTHLSAYAGSNAIDLVFGACNVIAETVSAAGYKLETEDGRYLPLDRGEADDYARLAPPELRDLLRKPNPWQTWDDLIEELVIDYLLTGDFFVYKYGVEDADGMVPGERPVALYRLAPDRVTVKTGDEVGHPAELIGGYEYDVPGSGSEPALYAPEEVIQLRRPNVHSPYRGAGIISGSPTLFDLELALTQSKEAFARNGHRLAGVVETDRSIPDNLINKLKREFNGLFSGPDAAGMTAVLSAGAKYNTIQSSSREAEVPETSKQTMERVIAMFRVPKGKLGFPAGEDPGEERREFANGMVRPLLDRIENVISDRLTIPGWGIKFCIDYEYQMPIEEQIKLAGTYGTLPGITIREVRDKAGLVRLTELMEDEAEAKKIEEVVLNLPGADDNASTIKDRNLPGEAGRPPNPEHTSVVAPAAADAEADAEAAKRRELAGG